MMRLTETDKEKKSTPPSLDTLFKTAIKAAIGNAKPADYKDESLATIPVIVEFTKLVDNYKSKTTEEESIAIVSTCQQLLEKIVSQPLPTYIYNLIISVINYMLYIKLEDPAAKKIFFKNFLTISNKLLIDELGPDKPQFLFPSFDRYYLFMIRILVTIQLASIENSMKNNPDNCKLSGNIEYLSYCRIALENFIVARKKVGGNKYPLAIGAIQLLVRAFYVADLAPCVTPAMLERGEVQGLFNPQDALQCIAIWKKGLVIDGALSLVQECLLMHFDIYQARITITQMTNISPQTKKLKFAELSELVKKINLKKIESIFQSVLEKKDGLAQDFIIPELDKDAILFVPLLDEYLNLLTNAEHAIGLLINAEFKKGNIASLDNLQKIAFIPVLELKEHILLDRLDLLLKAGSYILEDSKIVDELIESLRTETAAIETDIKKIKGALAEHDALAQQAFAELSTGRSSKAKKSGMRAAGNAGGGKKEQAKTRPDTPKQPVLVSSTTIVTTSLAEAASKDGVAVTESPAPKPTETEITTATQPVIKQPSAEINTPPAQPEDDGEGWKVVPVQRGRRK